MFKKWFFIILITSLVLAATTDLDTPDIRMLQANNPPFYNQQIVWQSGIDMVGNRLIYDPGSKTFVYLSVGNYLSPTAIQLGSVEYAGNNRSPPRPTTYLNVFSGCSFKYNGAYNKRITFPLERVGNDNSAEYGTFIVMTNSSNPTQMGKYCPNDGANMYIIKYTDGLFTVKASWQDVMNSGMGFVINNINMFGMATCNNCNYFQPLASTYITTLNRFVVFFLFTDNNQDQANLPPIMGATKRYFVLVSFKIDSTIVNPAQLIDKVVIFPDTYSNQLINVRNLKTITGTSVVYFMYQEVKQSYMVTINTLNAMDNPFQIITAPQRRIQLKNDMLQNVFQESIEYDPVSAQFIQIYTTDVKVTTTTSAITFNAFFFQLNNDYLTIGKNTFAANYYKFNLNHPHVANYYDKVSLIRYVNGYLFFCDLYNCYFSQQKNTMGIGFDLKFNLLKSYQLYKNTNEHALVNAMSDFIEYIDVRMWFFGSTVSQNGPGPANPNYQTFIGYTDPQMCPFFTHWQNAFCYINCPNYLFRDGTICVEKCPANLIQKIPNYAGICLNTCPENTYANGNITPMECTTSTYCSDFTVPKFVFPGQNFYICAKTCPKGTSVGVDDQKKNCLGCRSTTEGYSYQGGCVKTCPEYTVPYTSPNACVNCKDLGKLFYNKLCWDSPYPGTTLVNDDFSAYMLCKDQAAGKLYYDGKCVDSCPDNNYPYDGDKNTCTPLFPVNFLNNGYIVTACPKGSGYKSDRVCYVCRGRLEYYYNGNCVTSCPDNYFYDDSSVCLQCGTNGDWSTNFSYLNRCVAPDCPDYAPLNYMKKRCVYCNETGLFWVNGKCDSSCPVFSSFDITKSKCTDCLGAGDVYYRNQCYSACPGNTIDTGYGYCKERQVTCSGELCNNRGTCYIDGAGRQKCKCENNVELGQYCQLSYKYINNYYDAFSGDLYSLTSNYSFFSTINQNIKNVTNETFSWIGANMYYLEANHPNFDFISDDLISKLLTFLHDYNFVMGSLNKMPIQEAYDMYDFILNVTTTEVNYLKSQQKKATLRNLAELYNVTETIENYQTILNQIREQIPMLAYTTSTLKAKSKMNTEMTLNYTNYFVTFYNTSSFSLKKFMEYSIENSLSYIDLADCEEYLKQSYNVTYFLLYKIDWKSDFIKYTVNDNLTAVDPRELLDFYMVEPVNYTTIDYVSECSDRSRFYKYPISNVDGYSFDKYYYYKKNNINFYDFNSRFYTDRCFIYVENKLDVTLLYRRKVMAPEVMVSCEGCTFIGIDYFNYTICECLNEGNQRVDIVKNNFTYNGNNLPIITCLPQLLGVGLILNNTGFWFGICLLFAILTSILMMRILYRRELRKYLDVIIYNDANYFYSDILPLPSNDLDIEVRKEPRGKFCLTI
jgi:hypothetical protein